MPIQEMPARGPSFASRSLAPPAVLALALAALVPSAATGQPIATDRPGFRTGTAVVAPGVFQLELGVPNIALSEAGAGDVRLVNFPLLARLGVGERVEFRVESPVYNILTLDRPGDDDPDEEGFGDLTLGVKWNAVEAVGSSPGVAVVPRITLPVGEEPFTIDERVGFAVDVPVEAALGPSTSWNVSGGVAWTPVGDDDWRTSGLLALTLATGLAPDLGGYVEVAVLPVEGGDDEPAFLGAGITYLLNPDAQLDVFVDAGLNDASEDVLVGSGISFRLR